MTMTTSRFSEVIQRTLDRRLSEETLDIPAEYKQQMIRELREFYQRYQATIDLAIEGALALSDPAADTLQIDLLEDSLRQDPMGFDSGPAHALLYGDALQPMVASAQAQGLLGVSVGLSLGISLLLVGGAAGADVLIKLDDNKIYVRGFAVADVGLDLFAGIGLNIGIWQALPTIDKKVYIGGLLLDIPLEEIGLPIAIRIMLVREGPGFWSSPSDFKLLGFTFAINYGAGVGLMAFRGVEYLLGIPPKRAQLTVSNCTDSTNPCQPGTSSIAQNVSSTLVFTLKNTSGQTITIANGDSMLITMPSFFSVTDLNDIDVTPPTDWVSNGFTTSLLTLQYNGASTLSWTTLVITLNNAKPSQSSPIEGTVNVTIPNAVVQNPTINQPGVVATASLTLVPSISYATISQWTLTHPDFPLVSGYTDSGTNVSVNSQDNRNVVVTLSEVTDSKGAIWILGYQFYVDSTTNDPRFRACWQKKDVFSRDGVTFFAPNFTKLTTESQTSTAFYGNVEGNTDYIEIQVALNS